MALECFGVTAAFAGVGCGLWYVTDGDLGEIAISLKEKQFEWTCIAITILGCAFLPKIADIFWENREIVVNPGKQVLKNLSERVNFFG